VSYLAKPSGITLKAHTANVERHARELLAVRPFMAEKYARLTGDDLSHQLIRAARAHDLGKKHAVWQSACRKDYEVYRRWRQRQGLDPDALSASDYDRYRREERTAGSALRTARLRHEFDSLVRLKKLTEATLPERAAIAAHHRKLGRFHEHRWKEDGRGAFRELWKEFVQDASVFFHAGKERTEKVVRERYRIAAVRALLQLADTRASREEAGGKLPDITPFSYSFPHHKENGDLDLRPVQSSALENSNLRELILRAPTGSGKTDASLLWAQQQIEATPQRADRLIIAMPTRFTSNALAINVAENLSDTGLYHSSAWFARYHQEVKDDWGKRDKARELHKLSRLLVTPITVCTVDHLLMALTGSREDHHAIFFNLANACIVFDETDFYDPFVQANLLVLLRVLRLLEVPFMMMSATVPESARELYGITRETVEPQRVTNRPEDPTPVRVLQRAGVAERPEHVEEVLNKIVEAGRGIIYANTVERALAYYRWFEGRNVKSILYHSLFTEPDKKRIEGELIEALGRKAWQNKEAHGIAVLTQIGEMSINISAPLMLSDLCPMDRLAQRAGRLVRFAEAERGMLYVVTPQKEGEFYPAPYGEWEKNHWKPAEALLLTQHHLKDGPFTSTDLVEAVNALYPNTPQFDSKSTTNQQKLYEALEANWLIVPKAQSEEGEEDFQLWKSRDIGPHRTVLTECPESFDSYDEYRSFELEYGVSCPSYLVDKELRREQRDGLGSRITVLKRFVLDEEVQMLYTPDYDHELGLAFLREPLRSDDDWSDVEPLAVESSTCI
jgi:CRISPR-associated endonuclease/helicase Cas3